MSATTNVASVVDRGDAEVRDQGRERVRAHLRLRARHGADERALADVRKAEQPDVGHHLQLEPELLLFARFARLGAARCAIVRRREVDVASATAPAAGDDDLFALRVHVEDGLVRLRVEALRAHGHAHDAVWAALAVLVLAAPVLAALGDDATRERHVDERQLALVADEDDVAALAAVTPRGPAVGRVLLAAERDAAVAAGTGHDLDLARIDELHGVPAIGCNRSRPWTSGRRSHTCTRSP